MVSLRTKAVMFSKEMDLTLLTPRRLMGTKAKSLWPSKMLRTHFKPWIKISLSQKYKNRDTLKRYACHKLKLMTISILENNKEGPHQPLYLLCPNQNLKLKKYQWLTYHPGMLIGGSTFTIQLISKISLKFHQKPQKRKWKVSISKKSTISKTLKLDRKKIWKP